MTNNGRIVQLLNPTNNQDAATKSYVDTATTNMATTSSVSTAITTALGSSGTDTNRPTIQRDDGTYGTHYLTYINSSDIPNDGSSKRALMRCDDNLRYNPAVNTLYAGTFSGPLSGNASSASSAAGISNGSDSTFVVGGGERMRITSAGRIGIGTSSPVAPLEIQSFFTTAIPVGAYIGAGPGPAGSWTGTQEQWNISLKTGQSIWIAGMHLWITSDQRIKTNITSLSADKMINVFRNLRPISFDFIDPTKNNNKKHFGFIAQEVNEILPEGITLNTDVIPNNMTKADIAKPSETDENPHFTLKPTDTDITLQYLLLTTDTPLNFDTANSYSSTNIYKFKIYGGDKWTKEHDIYIRSDYNVTDDKYTYVIGLKKEAYDMVITEPTLFVYGQYVYDLHILEHDTIYTVATAALQEVDRQQQADKARIAELENQVSNLEAKVSAQQSLINDILERLKALERA